MNKQKRSILASVKKSLMQSSDIVSGVLDAEQDCLDNLPENLETSELYEKIELAIEKLEDAIESIDSAVESIEEAMV